MRRTKEAARREWLFALGALGLAGSATLGAILLLPENRTATVVSDKPMQCPKGEPAVSFVSDFPGEAEPKAFKPTERFQTPEEVVNEEREFSLVSSDAKLARSGTFRYGGETWTVTRRGRVVAKFHVSRSDHGHYQVSGGEICSSDYKPAPSYRPPRLVVEPLRR